MKTQESSPAVPWRDLLPLTRGEVVWETLLPVPWLAGSLALYSRDLWLPGLVGSFYFFLTGLRQSHGAQHYSLGLARWAQDFVLFLLSIVMGASMHAVQTSHLHHHRHCLEPEDTESSAARLPWWQAVLVGPVFVARLHASAWTRARPAKRRWIAAELAAIAAALGLVATGRGGEALRWHFGAMLLGECLTGFFAVWTVHHGCEGTGFVARTQRGGWINRLCYDMFYHAEHHWFPRVPTCHLRELARRLDAAMPGARWPEVAPMPGGTGSGARAAVPALSAPRARSRPAGPRRP
jgi:fatty acid desaturase